MRQLQAIMKKKKRKVPKNKVINLISKCPSFSILKATSVVGVYPILVFSIFQDNLQLKSNPTKYINGTSWKLTI